MHFPDLDLSLPSFFFRLSMSHGVISGVEFGSLFRSHSAMRHIRRYLSVARRVFSLFSVPACFNESGVVSSKRSPMRGLLAEAGEAVFEKDGRLDSDSLFRLIDSVLVRTLRILARFV